MTKYQVGDKVLIKKNLKVDKRYDGDCLFREDMTEYLGKVLTIKHAYSNYEGKARYDVEESYWTFTDSMIERKVEKKEDDKMEFKVGNKVKLNKKIEKFKHGRGAVTYEEIGTISRIDGNEVRIDFPNLHCWDGLLKEIVPAYTIKTTDDLEFGDIITLRNEEKYVYADEALYGDDDCNECDGDCIDYWNDETLKNDDEEYYDIMKVEREGQVIYDRNKEVKEMTVEEISEALGYEVKVIKG